jgi:hypothetical protein
MSDETAEPLCADRDPAFSEFLVEMAEKNAKVAKMPGESDSDPAPGDKLEEQELPLEPIPKPTRKAG